ncbi:selenocysteine-specific translation elongation factor [Actinopolyspora erythraea]|uniref:Selenocysteine-specific elongation factor n=1 Tax=Actinopolyspora erythraea TaxID=414996 RepID=A0A099D6M2_9ACTN|nr:selenocysteine-specific translation elongation factor [Actinopolyspora erythraea]ASU78721.1 selenocysteine-specific translation elongation factor [Actinopolyspora erythraea]KGI81477.1 translation elongation factor [Actinopolyspora erythraea]
MRVIATAGHVDHGKSTLIHALTGIQPDRWTEERRRGLTIDLGFAWRELPGGERMAFVDVPGHQRFVRNMLAGVGEVTGVLFVVAADEGWMPQSDEHLRALHALRVRHGVLTVTRSDLADPLPALHQARRRLSESSLAGVPEVVVSGSTGAGLGELTAALDDLARRMPTPDPDADVRLWLDRSFGVHGAGTVVTATLSAGTLTRGDELVVARTGRRVTIRGLQSLGEEREAVGAPARAALNLRGIRSEELDRGDALLTPGAWRLTECVDVLLRDSRATELPRELGMHIGAAATPVRVRPLGHEVARLSLHRALPLRIGDTALLRDAGRHLVPTGVRVLDVCPPALRRRGAAAARAAELRRNRDRPAGAVLLERRGVMRAPELRAAGVRTPPWALRSGDWLLAPDAREDYAARLVELLDRSHREHPMDDGITERAALRRLGLPHPSLLPLVLDSPRTTGVTATGGRLRLRGPELSEHVREGVAALRERLAERPFEAPTAGELRRLELDTEHLGAASRAGELLRVAEGIYLLPGALRQARDLLARLPEPFTPSQAREVLGTSRRVAVPLLERLAREGYTRRLPDGTHRVLAAPPPER